MLLLPEGHVQRDATQNTDSFPIQLELQRYPHHQKETTLLPLADYCYFLISFSVHVAIYSHFCMQSVLIIIH